ncbi:3-isopropylmalate dehydratase, small subunit [Bradyrhizobium sp. YR681]|uniref:3-isopropylmalate dehydratase small subunit n=1 Tax=Bradyrhizobium sp. YR681 TaxID=1144344 RepID=UPI0002710D52|nr:3-isopropylmalate dehydratase small subunit [Bradyrhizobium sp. YR681]EJN11310.1 3-isopropylmalate dehydratase, small subunit [Bradyrhizobium sp. YR681]
MRPFTTITALACKLAIDNIDTDQLIPARFMRRPRSEGYGNFLLHDLRFDTDGAPKPQFPLNDPKISGCEIIIAGRNFGCGSSREAAVYALADYGIRVVIASSFGDIFASNAVKNGVLPAQISEEDSERLLRADELVERRPLTIDLAAQTITVGNLVVTFSIDAVWKKQLLNGWDDIDMTRNEADTIARFAEQDAIRRPWMKPAGAPPPIHPRRGENR